VGGIREKVLAARHAGVQTVILPDLNRRDIEEIPPKNIKGLRFVFAKDYKTVYETALGSNSAPAKKKRSSAKRKTRKK
jgi:ATP-dependent Lon protease